MSKTHKSFRSFANSFKKQMNDSSKKSAKFAINRTLDSTKSQAVKAAASETGAKQKDIRFRVGTWKATDAKPKGLMVNFSKPVSLSIFQPKIKKVDSAKGKRQGVSVKIGGERDIVPGGFIFSKKHESAKGFAVFRRFGPARLPIGKVLTQAVWRVMGRPDTMKTLEKHATETLKKNFIQQLKRFGFK